MVRRVRAILLVVLASSLLILELLGAPGWGHPVDNLAPASGDQTPNPAVAKAATPLDHLPALAGGYFRIDSRAVGRPFHIYVRLPDGYETDSDRRYPTVYVLDGDSLFPILAASHLFLTYDLGLPEAVVVGISYGSFAPDTNRRGFDFSAPTPDGDPARGGAENFHRFLSSELLPRIEKDYRVDPERRILFGQSRGGSMVLYSAFRHPDLFWGRIANNPAFDPGRELYFSTPAPAERKDLGLVVTSGSEDYPPLREAALAWSAAWQDADTAPWAHEVLTIPGGTHSAYSGTSYRLGLLWLYCRDGSWSPPDESLCLESEQSPEPESRGER